MPDSPATIATHFLEDTAATFRKQKDLAERAMAQVNDDEFFHMIDAESNSIAIIVQHVGGNLRSRFTDFLTTDGEKPDRDRDNEFLVAGSANRAAIMARWETGWETVLGTVASLRPEDVTATVRIRGEEHSALGALHRSLAHVAQHVGQIVLLAKHLRSSDWKTLSIPRGASRTWHP